MREAYVVHSPDSIEARALDRAHAELAAERATLLADGSEGRLEAWTASLLASSLTEATAEAVEEALGEIAPYERAEDADDADAIGPLRRGLTNDPRVEAMQRRLEVHGFEPGPIDGNFGPITAGALEGFQLRAVGRLRAAAEVEGFGPSERRATEERLRGLRDEMAADVAGAVTLALLDEPPQTSAAGTAAQSPSGPYRFEAPLALGDIGPAVAALQQRLAALAVALDDPAIDPGTIDGDYGEDTADAVRAFQDDQLRLVQHGIDRIAALGASAPHRSGAMSDLLAGLRTGLVNEKGLGGVADTTGRLLEEPLDAATIRAMVDWAGAPPTLEEVRGLFAAVAGAPSAILRIALPRTAA